MQCIDSVDFAPDTIVIDLYRADGDHEILEADLRVKVRQQPVCG